MTARSQAEHAFVLAVRVKGLIQVSDADVVVLVMNNEACSQNSCM